MSRILVYLSLDSQEAFNGTCDQRRLRSDCANAQSDLSLRWSNKSYFRFSRALAHILIFKETINCLGKSIQMSRKALCLCRELRNLSTVFDR